MTGVLIKVTPLKTHTHMKDKVRKHREEMTIYKPKGEVGRDSFLILQNKPIVPSITWISDL
jgi:hypothetical protein